VGWGVLVALSSVFMAPKIRNRFGTFNSIYYVLSLLVILLFIMGIFTSSIPVLVICIILSGILMGNVNTLLTTAMIKIGGDDRSTTSAAYNFIRFIGSAIAPILATIIGERIAPNLPFISGGLFVLVAIVFLYLNRKYIPAVDEVFEKFEENIFLVKDFMVKDVIKIKASTKVEDVLEIFDENKINDVPVVDENNKFMDIITSGDIIRYLVPKEEAHDLFYSIYVEEESEQDILNKKINATANDIIKQNKKKLFTLNELDTFEKAINIISTHHFKIIPVLSQNNEVIGIISRGEINNTLIKISLKDKSKQFNQK
jgi:CBS domain-containing protein